MSSIINPIFYDTFLGSILNWTSHFNPFKYKSLSVNIHYCLIEARFKPNRMSLTTTCLVIMLLGKGRCLQLEKNQIESYNWGSKQELILLYKTTDIYFLKIILVRQNLSNTLYKMHCIDWKHFVNCTFKNLIF